jgi:hypothetical protein
MARTVRALRALAVVLGSAAVTASCAGSPLPVQPEAPQGSEHGLLSASWTVFELIVPLDSARAELVVPPSGGTYDLPGGHRITFPAGAVSEPTVIAVTAGGSLIRLRFEPHGLTFPANAAPRLRLSAAGSLLSLTLETAILYADEAGQPLEVLSTRVSLLGNWAETPLRHFSHYAIANQ